MTDYTYLPVNEKTDLAVRGYAEKIVEAAGKLNSAVYIDVTFDDAMNAAETERAPMGALQGEHGVVLIWPDFINSGAVATVYNRGRVQSMQLEGFEEDEIDKAVIVGKMLTPTDEHIKVLAYFLTRDLGLQAQKDFRDPLT